MRTNTICIIGIICFTLASCTSKSSDSTETESVVDESGVVPDSTVSISEIVTQPDVPEGSLLIHGKDIWVRDYPNTGKVVMTLNEGDVCKILKQGRYDVIRDDGNNWYEIQFEGNTGWVFGSQTDQHSDNPEFWDPNPQGNSLQKEFNMKVTGMPYGDLLEITFDQVLKQLTPSDNDDAEANSLDTERQGSTTMIFNKRTPVGFINRTITQGATNSVLQSINCEKEIGASSLVKRNYSLLCSNINGKCSVVAEINGAIEEIIPLRNGKYLIVAKYAIADLSLPQNRGHVWIGVYNPATNTIENIRKYGFYFSPLSPMTRNDRNEPFLVTCIIDPKSQLINMYLNEEYRVYNDGMEITQQYNVNRFFRFNESKGFFEENKQEEIIEVKS